MNAEVVRRFWSKVRKTRGCWRWVGTVHKRGRGQFWDGSRMTVAARFSYELLVGEIPPGLYVCHHCDNPLCVRPDHLFVGTQNDNMKDMAAKGRANRSVGARNGRAKLTEADVRYIRANWTYRSRTHSQKQLAAAFGVDVITIQQVLYRKRWAHVS